MCRRSFAPAPPSHDAAVASGQERANAFEARRALRAYAVSAPCRACVPGSAAPRYEYILGFCTAPARDRAQRQNGELVLAAQVTWTAKGKRFTISSTVVRSRRSSFREGINFLARANPPPSDGHRVVI